MLFEKLETVYADLIAHQPLVDLLSKGVNGIRPLIAEVEDGDVFITYKINFNGFAAKSNVADLKLIVQCWAETLKESLKIADEVYSALGASNNFYTYDSAIPTYNEQNEIYTEQVFTIKN